MSNAVERAYLWGSPCGLPNLDSIKFKFFAYLFINDINWLIQAYGSNGFAQWNLPPHKAKLKAASFPLGNIKPYNKLSTV